MNQPKSTQRGMTFISLVMLLTILGFLLLLLMKIGPVYMENYTVKNVLNNLQHEPGIANKSIRELRRIVDNQLYVNEVRRLKRDHIKFDREDGQTLIKIDYEVRVKIMANVDAIVTFKERTRLGGPR